MILFVTGLYQIQNTVFLFRFVLSWLPGSKSQKKLDSEERSMEVVEECIILTFATRNIPRKGAVSGKYLDKIHLGMKRGGGNKSC